MYQVVSVAFVQINYTKYIKMSLIRNVANEQDDDVNTAQKLMFFWSPLSPLFVHFCPGEKQD